MTGLCLKTCCVVLNLFVSVDCYLKAKFTYWFVVVVFNECCKCFESFFLSYLDCYYALSLSRSLLVSV